MSAPQIAIEPPQAVTPIIEPVTIEKTDVIIADPFRSNPIGARLMELYNSFQEKRAALGLSHPGTIDGIAREVERDVLLNNYAFVGLDFDVERVGANHTDTLSSLACAPKSPRCSLHLPSSRSHMLWPWAHKVNRRTCSMPYTVRLRYLRSHVFTASDLH